MTASARDWLRRWSDARAGNPDDWLERGSQGAAPGSGGTSDALAAAAALPADSAGELSFLNGLTSTNAIAGTSFWTWNGDNPATYSTTSWAAKWGSTTPGTGSGTITYWFDTASSWTTTEKNALISGLGLWSAVANVQFAAASSAATASFVFYRGTDSSAYEASSQTLTTVGSSKLGTLGSGTYISIDTRVGGFGPIGGSFSAYGGYPYMTVEHEIGHLLGLGHAGIYNGSLNASTQQFSAFDTRLWTIMSYIDPWTTSAKYYGSYPVTGTQWGVSPDGYYHEPTTPMILDVAAIQQLYGAATTGPLAGGGQVFGFHCNVGGTISSYFDFTVNTHPVITIWDGGTNNTLDLSGWSTGGTINLNPGTYSSADGMTNNIGIANGTVINTLVCGGGTYVVTGNVYGDIIVDGSGNGTYNCAGTNNTVVFSGNRSNYAITLNADGSIHVVDLRPGAPSGTDNASDVQYFQFADGTVATSSLFGPAASPPTIGAFSPDSGVASDGVTNATVLTLSGSAVAGSTVTVYDGTTLLGSAPADTGGHWSYTTGTLAGGGHSFTATDTVSGSTSAASSALAVTIDTTAPTVSSVVQSPASGALNAGKTVTLTLNLSEAVTVTGGVPKLTLNDGGIATYTGGSGTTALTFSYTVAAGENTTALAATAVNLGTAVVQDKAGNAMSLSLAGLIQSGPRIDTAVPLAPVIAADTVNADSTVSLSGSAEAGSTVTLWDGTIRLGSVVADGGGGWSYTTGQLGSGMHALTATATDAAGNVSAASTAVDPVISVAGPTIGSFSPDSGVAGDGVTNATALTLSGSAVAGSTVNVYDGTTLLGSAPVDAGGNWSYTTGTLAPGGHSFTATDTVSGVTSAPSAALAVTIDTTAPTVSSVVQSPASGTLNAGRTVTLTLNLSEAVTVSGGVPTLTLNDGGIATYTGGSGSTTALTFSYTVAAGENTTALAATAVNLGTAVVQDSAGNATSLSLAGLTQSGPRIDTAAPAAPVITTDTVNSNSTVSLSGSAEAGSTVTIYDGTARLGSVTASGGSWSYTTGQLGSGMHALTATATDAAGNVSAASTAVDPVIGPAAPTIGSFSPDSGTVGDRITNATVLTVKGTAVAGSAVSLYDGTMLVGTATASSTGAWSVSTTTLGNGTHSFTATDTVAGATSAASAALSVTVDTVAPSAPIIKSTKVSGRRATLTGTGEAGSTVKVFDGTRLLGSASVSSSGAWSFTTPNLTRGTHRFTTTDTDVAGNTSGASAAVTVSMSSSAPRVAELQPAPATSELGPSTPDAGGSSRQPGSAAAGDSMPLPGAAGAAGGQHLDGAGWAPAPVAPAGGGRLSEPGPSGWSSAEWGWGFASGAVDWSRGAPASMPQPGQAQALEWNGCGEANACGSASWLAGGAGLLQEWQGLAGAGACASLSGPWSAGCPAQDTAHSGDLAAPVQHRLG